MLHVLHLPDTQTGRFWRIETLKQDLMLNWGRVGSSGRYELRSYPSSEECEKEANSLLQSKLRAGYQEDIVFDPTKPYYYDDDDYGLHPLTSHPTFRRYFQSPIYYSSIEEGAPFGNDEGSDALWELGDLLRRRPKADLIHYPISLLTKLYHLPFYPPKGESSEDLAALKGEKLEGRPLLEQLRRTDRVILALALAQIKITGSLSQGLYTLALKALDRLAKLKYVGAPVRCPVELLEQERADLENYVREVGLH